jgi:hypothetical protein
VPFPIDNPELLLQFMPTSVRCYTTIFDDWNRDKIERLRLKGYEVEVLWERSREEKTVSGAKVRDSIVKGDSRWKEMVPSAIWQRLEDLDIASRFVG